LDVTLTGSTARVRQTTNDKRNRQYILRPYRHQDFEWQEDDERREWMFNVPQRLVLLQVVITRSCSETSSIFHNYSTPKAKGKESIREEAEIIYYLDCQRL
jgi:hypothetical protein